MNQKQYRDFENARSFVRNLGLKTRTEWREYCKSKQKPDDIPFTPDEVYTGKGWTNWGDFLGSNRVANQNKEFLKFDEAREIIHSLKLKNVRMWESFCKSSKKPEDIPSIPSRIYKNKGWISWGDWLGTENIYPQNKEFRLFIQAREFVRKLGLKRKTDWEKYCVSGNKPDDIPSSPRNQYKKDFKGWGDWLGTNRIAYRNRTYRSYKEAKEFVKKLGLKNYLDWNKYCKSGEKPEDIPAAPWNTYKEWGKK